MNIRRWHHHTPRIDTLTQGHSHHVKKWGTFVQRFWATKLTKRWSLKSKTIVKITLQAAPLFKTVKNTTVVYLPEPVSVWESIKDKDGKTTLSEDDEKMIKEEYYMNHSIVKDSESGRLSWIFWTLCGEFRSI